LNDLISNLVADLEVVIKSNDAKIQVEKLPVINADASDMKQLFQNLVSNAIKYRKKDSPPVVNISCENENGNWKFAVKDNGIGIDEKFSERIFVIFQRLHNRSQYEGTGIGLALCKKIVEIYGGKIWIKSQPGTGTIFYFTLKELK
jgi:light-regulated signal transduction histidine kinase (bacteriophytochrome)